MNDPGDNGGGTPFDGAASNEIGEGDRFYAAHERSSDRTLCGAIVDAVSAVSGESPTQLPPLHDSIDTDALENLVYGTDPRPNSERSKVSVSFQFAGTLVTASSDGTIVVDEVEDS
jgi:hypothetical protein